MYIQWRIFVHSRKEWIWIVLRQKYNVSKRRSVPQPNHNLIYLHQTQTMKVDLLIHEYLSICWHFVWLHTPVIHQMCKTQHSFSKSKNTPIKYIYFHISTQYFSYSSTETPFQIIENFPGVACRTVHHFNARLQMSRTAIISYAFFWHLKVYFIRI